MRKAELINYFKARFPYENYGGGDWSFTIKNDEQGRIKAIPGYKNIPNGQYAYLGLDANPHWFDDIQDQLSDMKGGGALLLGQTVRVESKIGPLDVETACAELISKAYAWFTEECQLESLAPKLRKPYDNYEGAGSRPFYHITACILKGDVRRLQGYLEAFKNGDRLNFNVMVEQKDFERAIPLAEKYRSGELVSPIDF